MQAHFIVREPCEPESLRSFANIINVGYSLSKAADLPVSVDDDVVAIPHYRQELEEACLRAAALCSKEPTIEEMLWHSLKINAVVVELCGAAPRAVKECSLSMRGWVLALLDESSRDRHIRE